jgi:hypothetical protein
MIKKLMINNFNNLKKRKLILLNLIHKCKLKLISLLSINIKIVQVQL